MVAGWDSGGAHSWSRQELRGRRTFGPHPTAARFPLSHAQCRSGRAYAAACATWCNSNAACFFKTVLTRLGLYKTPQLGLHKTPQRPGRAQPAVRSAHGGKFATNFKVPQQLTTRGLYCSTPPSLPLNLWSLCPPPPLVFKCTISLNKLCLQGVGWL